MFKSVFRRVYDALTRRLVYRVTESVKASLDPASDPASKLNQIVVARAYAGVRLGHDWAADAGFRAYSQSDEDGLLLCLFSVVGATSRRCVEIGGLDARGANTTNLLVNWGWSGLIVEGDPDRAAHIRRWFEQHPDTGVCPPDVVTAWVSAANIDQVLTDAAWSGEIDLLSIDIDGIDYWLWDALEAARPRVVVCEVNPWIPDDRSITVPDDASFTESREHTLYFGASLRAIASLGRRKGYRLVACNRQGVNAIFVRDDVAGDRVPELAVDDYLATRPRPIDMFGPWSAVSDLPWVEV